MCIRDRVIEWTLSMLWPVMMCKKCYGQWSWLNEHQWSYMIAMNTNHLWSVSYQGILCMISDHGWLFDWSCTEVYISPKNEYFCITPKNGSAQECGPKGGPHGNISAWKSNITAWIQNKALFLHGEITNLPLIIQCIDFVPFLLINGTWKRINIAFWWSLVWFGPIQIVSRAWLGNAYRYLTNICA